MSQVDQFGKPIHILKFSETNQVVIDNIALEGIFHHPEIQDHKIVILSLIGAFRGGKSFFLDYCLRFLYANYPSLNNPNKKSHLIFKKDKNWMGEPDEPLKGFSWRSGTERDTTGIIFWSDVFLHTTDTSGEKLAIFVMDTQGLFDSNSSPTDNSRIFALGTLTSSIQVLNIIKQIQEDQLQYLQFAMEFTNLHMMNIKSRANKPFQNLMFLIRDWDNDDEYQYGPIGGHAYISQVLTVKPNQQNELKSVRETIFESFDKIQCFLMPYPGTAIAGRRYYDGRWSEMDKEFKSELQNLIELLLMPENLVIKKINSKEITVKEMRQFSKSYLESFQSNETPQVSSIYELTVESHMTNLLEKSIDDYKLTIRRNEDLINEESIPKIHEKCKERALELYDAQRKMGTVENVNRFRAKLEGALDSIYKTFKEINDQGIKKINLKLEEQKAQLKMEQQQRIQAEKILKQIEKEMEKLQQRQSEYEGEEFKRHKLILEARDQAERMRMNDFENQIRMEERFRSFLIAAAGLVVSTLVNAFGGGLAAGVATLSRTAAAVTSAGSAIEDVCDTIKCKLPEMNCREK